MKKLEWLWVVVRTTIKKGEDLIKKDSRFQKTILKSFSQAFQNQGWCVVGVKGRVEMKKLEWLWVVVRTTIKKGEDLRGGNSNGFGHLLQKKLAFWKYFVV